MFTGIVEQVGEVVSLDETENGRRMVLRGERLGDLPVGASISVNGVCLTVVDLADDTISLDVVPETLTRSNLGSVRAGARVNLERPMPADGRFDGHIVQGHVDGTGTVVSISRADDGSVVMEVEVESGILRYLVEKASITIDGVSLTVAGVKDRSFTVALIPHTLAVTTLGLRQEGDEVNLEVDVLAKYVERLISGAR
ncbi:MAG TPA: riboflavin synthase [Acidimicrobiia bacterium]|nr:riboflavin synthase [Acidimicrobiia bacterium]